MNDLLGGINGVKRALVGGAVPSLVKELYNLGGHKQGPRDLQRGEGLQHGRSCINARRDDREVELGVEYARLGGALDDNGVAGDSPSLHLPCDSFGVVALFHGQPGLLTFTEPARQVIQQVAH